nr:Retrovirus-related Pol polyprotein from transposon TNT 1-94 [Ipomoea trifida]
MASDGFVQPAIPRFDGHYDHWSMLMENFLKSKEFWDVVEADVAEPTAGMTSEQRAELKALKLKDLRAKNYLFQAIDRSILETILRKETSKQIWDSMKIKYQGSTKAKRQLLQSLRSEFETLRMKEGESATEYMGRLMTVVNQLRTNGDKTTDVTVVEKILRSMTSKYDFVVCAIEEANDIDKMTLDELESSLRIHEKKFIRQANEGEQALKATTDGTSNRSNRGAISSGITKMNAELICTITKEKIQILLRWNKRKKLLYY